MTRFERDNVQHPGKQAEISDHELIAAINRGDESAFESLYFRHRPWVLNLALRFTGDESLALDVMQETFLYLLRKFPGFKLTAQLRTFLYPAVKNLAVAARRKAVRSQSSAEGDAALEHVPCIVAASSNNDDLAMVLAQLSAEHREVLWLRFVDDLPLAEIAEALEVPLGTVKSRLHNGLNALRNDPRTEQFFEP